MSTSDIESSESLRRLRINKLIIKKILSALYFQNNIFSFNQNSKVLLVADIVKNQFYMKAWVGELKINLYQSNLYILLQKSQCELYYNRYSVLVKNN